MPAAIRTAAATRRAPNCSFRKTIPITAAKITLVSLTVATSAWAAQRLRSSEQVITA